LSTSFLERFSIMYNSKATVTPPGLLVESKSSQKPLELEEFEYVRVPKSTRSEGLTINVDKKEKNITCSLSRAQALDVVKSCKLALHRLPPKFTISSMKSSLANLRLSCYLYSGSPLSVQAVAGKYILSIGGSTSFGPKQISSSLEWSSFNAIFDEFFIHEQKFEFRPNNKYSSNAGANTVLATAAGAPGYLNTCISTWAALQHNQVVYADSSSAWAQAMSSFESAAHNLADNIDFAWKNEEHFDWDGPVGDQTTTNMTTTWCNFNNVASYGGAVQVFTPYVSGAAAGLGDLTESGVFGFMLIRYTVSWRCRS